MQRKVKAVTVVFEDGTTTTITDINGFYRATRNNKPREADPNNCWLDHEIRWSDRA